jgi:hypothetical protein
MKYKELWRVEQAFRTVKSVLDTRPIYHKCPIGPLHQRFGPAGDDTIKGHVFASVLALVVMHEMDRRLAAKGYKFEWEDVKRDLDALSEVEVFEGTDSHWLRTEFAGVASKVFSAIGIAAPPTVRATEGESRRLDGEPECSAKAAMPIRKSLRHTALRRGGVEDEFDGPGRRLVRLLGRCARHAAQAPALRVGRPPRFALRATATSARIPARHPSLGEPRGENPLHVTATSNARSSSPICVHPCSSAVPKPCRILPPATFPTRRSAAPGPSA